MQGERAVLTLTGVPSEALQSWLGEVRAAARARPVEAADTDTPGLHWQHRPQSWERDVKPVMLRRWVLAGSLFGVLFGLVSLPRQLACPGPPSANGNHVPLTDTRGTIWSGSGVLVLTGGDGSRDAASLLGRIAWRTGLQRRRRAADGHQSCCVNRRIEPAAGFRCRAAPGWPRIRLVTEARSWPAGWPGWARPGTPCSWAGLRLQSRDLRFERVEGRWLQQGSAQLDLVASRASRRWRRSYRFTVTADAANAGSSLL